ncbi:hypothetical protein [Oceanospirillum sediminis]|uniref:Uncharacterized protein n=1 Tax=Oceanospirillum sediminis TaxID=2760088 RepID=A0A839IWL1_9GAMM|nr:hypothetical protein [Oceanospirillum sediminis]MBB1489014.1 hypothetical protein [Oceanospirillum sediminis]
MFNKSKGAALVSLALFFSYGAHGDAQDNETIFNWAEGEYSSFFAPGGQATASDDPWTYRYYSATGTYLGINTADEVYVMGGSFGSAPVKVGSVSEFLAIINNSTGNGGTDTGGSGGCVNVPLPSSGTSTSFTITDEESGATGTMTITYNQVSNTRSVTTSTSKYSVTGFDSESSSVTTSDYRIDNGYVYESKVVTEATSSTPFGSFSDILTIEYSPEYLAGPALTYCEGQTWSSPSVQQTITSTNTLIPGSGSTISENTDVESGVVEGVNVSVTVPAGTFNAVVLKETDADGSYSKSWISQSHGVFIKSESYDASDNTTTSIEVESIN